MQVATRNASNAFVAAWAALAVGAIFALVSVYWGLGGTWLLDTVGGSLEDQGRQGGAGIQAVIWAAAILKAIAAVLPLLAIHSSRPLLLLLTWVEATILTLYGLVLTSVGLLLQAGVITASADADHRALAWHAYLWDPWFLIWGLLVVTALLYRRSAVRQRR